MCNGTGTLQTNVIILPQNTYIYIFFWRILHIYDCNAYSLTLTNAVESLPLDLFVLVHQSHTPSSLYPGTQKEQIQVVAGSL